MFGAEFEGLCANRDSNCIEISKIPQKLVKGQPRPRGPEHSSRIKARAPPGNCTVLSSQRGGHKPLPRAESHLRGGSKGATEGGYNRSNPNRSGPRFYTSLFLVPKKDGTTRPVVNLTCLNEYIFPHHFKMEKIHTLRDLLKTNDWITKVDLNDAYSMIPIQKFHRRILSLCVKESHFQFTCLPFGLSCTPWVFTKTLKPVTTMLRELGITLIGRLEIIHINYRGQSTWASFNLLEWENFLQQRDWLASIAYFRLVKRFQVPFSFGYLEHKYSVLFVRA